MTVGHQLSSHGVIGGQCKGFKDRSEYLQPTPSSLYDSVAMQMLFSANKQLLCQKFNISSCVRDQIQWV